MNATETKQLLSLISTYDRRPFPPEALDVWHAELRAVNYGDAVAAVQTIFRINGHDDRGQVRTLLPADVRRPAEAIGDTRRRKLAQAAIEGAKERRGSVGRPAAVERALAEARAKAAVAVAKYREPVAA
jgi:hypothetical protein